MILYKDEYWRKRNAKLVDLLHPKIPNSMLAHNPFFSLRVPLLVFSLYYNFPLRETRVSFLAGVCMDDHHVSYLFDFPLILLRLIFLTFFLLLFFSPTETNHFALPNSFRLCLDPKMEGFESEEVRNQTCLYSQMCKELKAQICGMVNFGILYEMRRWKRRRGKSM